jgi:Uncharacterised nucleotidyltransferase
MQAKVPVIALSTTRDGKLSPITRAFSNFLPALPSRFRFTTEFQLLLACCSIAPVSREPRRAEAIASLCNAAIHWDAFTSLVRRHQVPGLVHAALCPHGPASLPDRVRRSLKKQKLRLCGRALRHAAELVRLNTAFAEQGIDVIPLKGVGLSLRLFGDPGMRRLQDMDLLVKPEDLGRGAQLLAAHGYRCIFPDFPATPKMKEKMLAQDHHQAYWHDRLQILVELHWRIDQWTPGDVLELWNHCQKTEWMGTTIQQLDDDALLLFLCSHGAGHKWSCLKWLSDVAALMARQRTTTWDSLLDLAARFDLERALAQTALLLHWLYGTRPAEPLSALIRKERSSRDLARKAVQVMLLNETQLLASERFGQLKYLRYTLRLRRRLPFHDYMRQLWISSSYLRPLIWLKRHCRQSKELTGVNRH